MNDARAVRRRQRSRDLDGMFERMRDRQFLGSDDLLERAPLDVFHYQAILTVLGHNVVDGHDVGMIQGGSGAGFAKQALAAVLVRGGVAWQHLNGDGPLEASVVALVDLTHSAGAQQRKDFMRTDVGAGCQRASRDTHGRCLQEAGNSGLRRKHAIDFATQVGIAGASLVEE